MSWRTFKLGLLVSTLIAVIIITVGGFIVILKSPSNTTESITEGCIVGKIETGTVEEPKYSLQVKGTYTMPMLGVPMQDVELEGVRVFEVTREEFDGYVLGDWYAVSD